MIEEGKRALMITAGYMTAAERVRHIWLDTGDEEEG